MHFFSHSLYSLIYLCTVPRKTYHFTSELCLLVLYWTVSSNFLSFTCFCFYFTFNLFLSPDIYFTYIIALVSAYVFCSPQFCAIPLRLIQPSTYDNASFNSVRICAVHRTIPKSQSYSVLFDLTFNHVTISWTVATNVIDLSFTKTSTVSLKIIICSIILTTLLLYSIPLNTYLLSKLCLPRSR